MTLWIILTLMAAVSAAVLTIPLVRRHEARADARTATLAVLRDQLADVDVQLAAGAILPADAEGLRTEIKRRMLAAGHVANDIERGLGSRSLGGVAIGLAAMVALAAGALYASMGKPGQAAFGGSTPVAPGAGIAATAPAATPDAQAAELAALVGGLEKKMAENPSDPEGWRMLGWTYFQGQRFAEAATAYGKAVAIDPRGPGYQSAYGEALAQAAGGQVTPAAAAAFEAARAQDGNDARARYFLGVGKAQAGDSRGALDEWIGLLGDSAGDAPWVPQLRSAIEGIARDAKIDVTARLAALRPPASGGATVAAPPMAGLAAVAAQTAPPPAGPAQAAPGGAPGPSAEQVAGAATMTDADRQAMIGGMVDRLAARLAANPRDEAGWIRLMRARSVLGDPAAAAKARDAAIAAFAGDAAAQGRLRTAAGGMGITG